MYVKERQSKAGGLICKYQLHIQSMEFPQRRGRSGHDNGAKNGTQWSWIFTHSINSLCSSNPLYSRKEKKVPEPFGIAWFPALICHDILSTFQVTRRWRWRFNWQPPQTTVPLDLDLFRTKNHSGCLVWPFLVPSIGLQVVVVFKISPPVTFWCR